MQQGKILNKLLNLLQRTLARFGDKPTFSFGWYGNILLLQILLLLTACEKDITIETGSGEAQFVVEGYIESGLPPYLLLTRTTEYYSTFYLDSLSEIFVHDAVITVSDGTQTIQLTEFNIDTLGTSISAYVGFGMIGEVGKTYTLNIETEGKLLTAITTIPQPLPLDSIWYQTGADQDNDTLVELICRFSDPQELGQYIRYFTSVNNERYLPGFNSVFEDVLINGNTFDFPLDRGVDRNDTAAFDNYGLFRKGDTISVKWAAIDKAHFDFWRTVEFELGGQGSPFATPVIIQSNINGGQGIWGGYSSTFKSLIVPE